ncbi:unnamed protein product (macronuclear) [Paramecium tetraurelia]|uniref:DNA topoisomerase n=1 Tax=Paramecium tetraurelia TaxID=5888 RepID=A0DS57_PARTE|nr:uncharacterized protein GSPATT00019578001 [Paramecium tetraurelia]CAK85874.1 unnamed protein product [Paramecium tetraurelia]|eukprot:XP_001453271.1 hypothetical protein (macronuclear) [Paramecium tetraurelia strain d4-2]
MNKFKTAIKFGKIRVLNVAEKPSVARSIATVLARDHTIEETKSPYNKLFKFNFKLGEQDAEMWMTSVTGHLKNLKYPKQYQKWDKWDPLIILKDAEIENVISYEKRFLEENLQRFAKQCSQLILWLDCDREGENIAFEVLEVCKATNPQIKVHRAHFSAVTYVDIKKALENLQQPDENLSNSVLARQEIDLRIGASFTRFQTLLLQQQFNLSSIVSYGPCQIPTLGFVVQRQKEIDSFVKEKFWFIQCVDQTGCEYNWSRGNIFDEMIVLLLFERCFTEQAQVTDVQQKEVQKWKPYPLSTIEFEKLASRKLKVSAHKAMDLAEKLYNRGYISYPRTETNKFPPTINLQNIIRDQINHPVWGQYAQNLIHSNFDQPRAGNKDDKAHPPIHPVKMMSESDAQTTQEWDIYQLITRHFLACCSKNAKGSETTINLQVKEESFYKQGLIITEKNFLEIYPYDEWSQSSVPKYNIGDIIQINLKVQNGKTSPPKPLTEAELIGMMDKNGIGTDATIHEHINTIQERDYAIKKGQIIKPTKLGLALVESYEVLGFTLHKPHLRALMEQRMNEVAQGVKQKNEIVEATIKEMSGILQELQQKKNLIIQTFGQYLEALKDYDENNDDENPQNREPNQQLQQQQQRNKPTKKEQQQQQQQQQQNFQQKCNTCGTQLVEIKQTNGSILEVCLQCRQAQEKSQPTNTSNFQTKTFKTQTNHNNEETFKCNQCHKQMKIRQSKIKNSYFFGCLGYPQCNQAIFLPDSIKSIQRTEKKCKKCNSILFQTEYSENSTLQQKSQLLCLFPGCSEGLKTEWRNQSKESQQTNLNYSKTKQGYIKQQVQCKKCNGFGHLEDVCNNNTKTMISLIETNQEDKKDKLCPSCGVTGRHPKGSTCPMKRVKKKNQ